jgi:hypothetical protein
MTAVGKTAGTKEIYRIDLGYPGKDSLGNPAPEGTPAAGLTKVRTAAGQEEAGRIAAGFLKESTEAGKRAYAVSSRVRVPETFVPGQDDLEETGFTVTRVLDTYDNSAELGQDAEPEMEER